MRLVAGDRRDPLDEVEDARRRVALLGEHRLDDLRRLPFREATAPQEVAAVLVGFGHDPLARRPDALDEGTGRGVGEIHQRRRRLVGEARGGVFGMADGDLLEVLDTPQVPVLAHGAQIEARHAERLGADLRVPAVEAAEEQVGRAVGQPPRLDRVEIVDEEQEHVAVAGIECRRVLRDVDARVVDTGRPVEDAGDLPTRIPGAVAGDALHRLDQFMVVDAAIVRPGDGAQFDPAVVGLQRLDLLATMGAQPVLQIDAGERGGELTEIGGGRADLGGELAEAPVRRHDRRLRPRQDQREALTVAAVRLDVDEVGRDDAGAAAFRPIAQGASEITERQEPLVVRP